MNSTHFGNLLGKLSKQVAVLKDCERRTDQKDTQKGEGLVHIYLGHVVDVPKNVPRLAPLATHNCRTELRQRV